MLESFSRSVRNYVPSSIPIPSALPAPPRVSRPVSVGSFLPPSLLSTSPASPSSGIPRRKGTGSSGTGAISTVDWRARSTGQYASGLDEVFGSDEEEAALRSPGIGRTLSSTSYPGVGDGDSILWSRWDELKEGSSSPRYAHDYNQFSII